jgi:hypothetical protein
MPTFVLSFGRRSACCGTNIWWRLLRKERQMGKLHHSICLKVAMKKLTHKALLYLTETMWYSALNYLMIIVIIYNIELNVLHVFEIKISNRYCHDYK